MTLYQEQGRDRVGKGDAVLLPSVARALEQRNTLPRGLGPRSPAEGWPVHAAVVLPEFKLPG
ncbi:hypothetical protein [Streptomyces sp. SM11]|uniref:hypothetical protein n=1 Tax=Streptomyces sp. SM11 TaxID=565557 RepID=UPI0011B0A9BB|nr:hypothetical protein [Streptomyces sp. SM11]